MKQTVNTVNSENESLYWMWRHKQGLLGSPFLHCGFVAGNRLRCIHTPTVHVYTLKIGMAQRSES